jgi:hypothetical protein
MTAVALALSASAPAATPKPEPTPEAKALPKPEPAPSAQSPGGSTTQRVAPRTGVRMTRSAVLERQGATRRVSRLAATRSAAKPAAPVKRSPARSRRGAPPASSSQPLVDERRAPIDPPLSFVSAPLAFPERGGPALLAALALLALFAASASHLGLLYAVWKRVPG